VVICYVVERYKIGMNFMTYLQYFIVISECIEHILFGTNFASVTFLDTENT
jgi:hypothetical protein